MKFLSIPALLCMVLALYAFQAMPRCTTLEPETGKAGDAISAKGENLDKTVIADVYLTDGANDTKVTVTQQSGSEVKFTVPKVKAGRYHLAFLTANRASMIEQPVVLTVE